MNKELFITNDLIPKLNTLNGTEFGIWGKMNAHQMVEHLSNFFDISNGKLKFELVTPIEQLPKYLEYLRSEKDFKPNTNAPLSVLPSEPLPTKTLSLQIAITQLQQSILNFVTYYKNIENPNTVHPVFGALNYNDWVLLHFKHVKHHLTQFGLTI